MRTKKPTSATPSGMDNHTAPTASTAPATAVAASPALTNARAGSRWAYRAATRAAAVMPAALTAKSTEYCKGERAFIDCSTYAEVATYANVVPIENANTTRCPLNTREDSTSPVAPRRRPRPPAWRRSAGSDSGIASATAASITAARAATTQKETRQWETDSTSAPSRGPTTGAVPATAATTFIARTIRAPSVRSTTTDRAMTIAHPPVKPCTSRAAIITGTVGLNAHTTEAATNAATAASSGRRRPARSEYGPPTSCPSAMPTKNVVSVSCTWVADASRSRPTSGNAGTYMSVASGAMAVMSTIVPSNDAESAAALVGADDPREPGVGPAAAELSRVRVWSCRSGMPPWNRRPRTRGSHAREVYQQGIPRGRRRG